MAVLRLQKFGGVIPVQGDRALPDGFATESLNTWLYSSELRGIRPVVNLQAINSITRKVFRIPKRTPGGDPSQPGLVPPPSYLGDSVWMQFTDPDTDIVRGPLVNDQYERYYYCSPTTGPMYNTFARLVTGESGYKLGVVGPITAPGLSVTGGAATTNVTRAYIYTYASQYGEESQPSPPVTAAGKPDGTWHVTAIADPPADATRATITKKYVYRTITATSGVTTYFRVAEVAIGTTVYDDTLADTVLAGNLALESTGYAIAPVGMKGIIAMPNGFLVGFNGNTIYMSEPYQLHAWPAEYQQSTEYPIVGLGILGTTCVVCTQGYPATLSGVKPATVAFTKATTQEPCLCRGSIVSTPDGVYYASQNGLIGVSSSGINNITQQLITREDWVRLYAPANLRATRYQNGYLALRDIPNANNSAFFIDPTALEVALTEFSEFETCVNVHGDVWSGEVFVLDGNATDGYFVKRWDPPTDDLMPLLWRSKEFQYPKEANFAAYAIYWDQARFASNTHGTDIINAAWEVRFRVFCNRVLRYDQRVPKNGRPVRLPSGFKGDIWQFEVRCRAPVYSVQVASTVKELANA